MTSREEIAKIIYSLVIAGIIISAVVIYNFLGSSWAIYFLQTQGVVSEGGIFGNVAAAGGILAISIPMTLYLLKIQQPGGTKKVFFFFLTAIQFIAILLTNSRAAILAVFVAVLFVSAVLSRGKIKYFVSGALALPLLILIVFPGVVDVISVFLRFERVFENTRYQFWDMAFGMIGDHWLTGVGPGEFRNYIYRYIPVMIGSWDEQQIAWVYENAGLGHTHNFILFKFSELGLPGLLTAIMLPYLFLKLGFETMSRLKNESKGQYLLIVCAVGAGIGLFVRSFFESTGLLSYGWITRDLPFWLIFLIVIYYYQRVREV